MEKTEKMKIKNENIFLFFSKKINAEPTNTGKKQFYEHQSFGTKPEEPDQYYKKLMHGKRMFDLQLQEYKKLYFCNEWWGWHAIVNDWKDSISILWHLFPWK